MTRNEFEALVKDALEELPKEFKDKLQNVDVVIEEEFDMDTVKTLGLGAKGRFLGLYQGVPLKDRTHYYGIVMPDKITLYKQNIELACKASGLDIEPFHCLGSTQAQVCLSPLQKRSSLLRLIRWAGV